MERGLTAVPLKTKIAAMATALTAAFTGVGMSTTAEAAENGNVVVVGDSFTANPDEVRNAVRGSALVQSSSVTNAWINNYPQNGGCLQAPDNWPRLLSQNTGVPVSDWSCTAQTSLGAVNRIDQAIKAGDIHPGTRAVVAAVGMNDFGPFGILDGNIPFDLNGIHHNLKDNIRTIADKVRAIAPNAKIIIPGQLSISTANFPHAVCPINVIPNQPAGLPGNTVHFVEEQNRHNQYWAAQGAGATFIDIMESSKYHDTCASDQERYVAGAIDTTTPGRNMGLHPSRAGSEHIAQRVAEHL